MWERILTFYYRIGSNSDEIRAFQYLNTASVAVTRIFALPVPDYRIDSSNDEIRAFQHLTIASVAIMMRFALSSTRLPHR